MSEHELPTDTQVPRTADPVVTQLPGDRDNALAEERLLPIAPAALVRAPRRRIASVIDLHDSKREASARLHPSSGVSPEELASAGLPSAVRSRQVVSISSATPQSSLASEADRKTGRRTSEEGRQIRRHSPGTVGAALTRPRVALTPGTAAVPGTAATLALETSGMGTNSTSPSVGDNPREQHAPTTTRTVFDVTLVEPDLARIVPIVSRNSRQAGPSRHSHMFVAGSDRFARKPSLRRNRRGVRVAATYRARSASRPDAAGLTYASRAIGDQTIGERIGEESRVVRSSHTKGEASERKAVQPSRARRLAVRPRMVLATLVAISALCVAALLVLPMFQVKHLEIEGASAQTEARIRSALRAELRRPMLTRNVPAIHDLVRSQPPVRAARVVRDWPASLRVDIVEREPVARLRVNNDEFVIDGEGRNLGPVSERTPALITLRAAPSTTATSISAADRHRARVLGSLPASLRARVRGVIMRAGRVQVQLQVPESDRVLAVSFGRPADLENKVAALTTLLGDGSGGATFATDFTSVTGIDLSVPDSPVLGSSAFDRFPGDSPQDASAS